MTFNLKADAQPGRGQKKQARPRPAVAGTQQNKTASQKQKQSNFG